MLSKFKIRGRNVGWFGSFRLALHLARKMQAGLVRPTLKMRAENSGPPHISFCPFVFFFFKSYDKKLLITNKLGNFNKFTKLSKNFGELNNKLIIQHYHDIHIRTLTYTMYFQILTHSKIHKNYIFHLYKT